MFSKLTPTYKGILLSLLGYSLFSIVDTLGKWLAQSYTNYEIIAFQSLAALVMLSAFNKYLGAFPSLLARHNIKIHILRGIIGTCLGLSSVFVFAALPLTTVYTAIFTQPFFAVMLSVFIYKEDICWRRWFAIAVGFGGVLIAFRPWEASLDLSLLGTLFVIPILVAVLYTVMRSMKNASLFATGFYPNLVSCLVTMPFVLYAFPSIEPLHIAGFIALGILATSAFLALSTAYKIADASAVAPMHYVQMIWGVIYGFIFFGDIPTAWMMAGGAVVMASGLYLIIQERRFAQ